MNFNKRFVFSQGWRDRRFGFAMLLFISVLVTGCARQPPHSGMDRESDLEEICLRYAVNWHFDEATEVLTFIKGSSRAKGLVNSDVVVIDEQKIVLSKPIRKSKSAFIVPGDFKRKVIDPLLQSSAISSRRFKEIVIDPGHGGKDPGAKGRYGTLEKNVVLDIAARLKRNLEKNGFKVIMTRIKDEFISLEKRTEIASQSKADLFISIHANASRMKSAHGMEIYYLRELDSREKNEDQVKKNKRILFRQLAMDRDSPDLENILSDILYTYKRSESQQLASFVTRKTAGTMNALNRGSKSAGFFVLRNTLIPAILVEVGFLSNAKEEGLLKSSNYRQKIADGLSKSILEYTND